jgi:hypothetical protein
VAELQERMSSAEFSEWIEFYKIEPFGRDADFQGHAQTAAMIHNRSLGKNEKALKVEDLMPRIQEPQTTDQMIDFARMMTAAMSGMQDGG